MTSEPLKTCPRCKRVRRVMFDLPGILAALMPMRQKRKEDICIECVAELTDRQVTVDGIKSQELKLFELKR